MARYCILVATLLVVYIVAGAQGHTSSSARVTVGTRDGEISGVKKASTKGREYYAFQSIPFAKPPVGPLRLRDPVAIDGWDGVRDGSVMPPICPQIPWYQIITRKFGYEGSEDCLYLNLYTAKPGEKDADLPVMVFLHGGGFVAGGSDFYTAEVMMNHDIVFVVLQYRLGILGFLSTEDSVIPGNFGLKDQIMALRWIQNNVRNFGGDPTEVTLFGESAGGASVHFHYLSPYSQDLFSRGIMMSGSLFSPWARGAAYKEVAEFTGRLFGCEEKQGVSSGESSRALLNCLQKVDAKDLAHSLRHHTNFNFGPLILGPRVDGDYLPYEPEVLMRQARHKVADIISGITAHEGGIVTVPLFSYGYMKKALLENFEQIGPESLELVRGDENPQQLAVKVFEHYVGGVRVDETVADQLCQLYGDRLFNMGHAWVSRLHASNTHHSRRNTYLYTLNQRTERGYADKHPTNVGKHWVSHVDDLFFFFNGSFFGKLQREEDLRLRDIITQMWYNFAATGNPTPDDSLGFVWKPATPDNLQHLSIKLNPHMMPDTFQEARKFWESLPTKQNKLLNPDKVIHFHADDTHSRHPSKTQYTQTNDLPPKPYKHIHTEL